MASVPTVTQRSVFPSDEMLPTSNLRGSDAGLIFAEGVVRAGQTISHAMDPLVAAAAQIQAEDDKREVDKLDIEYSAFLRDITYGNGTEANPGFMNSLGENAINGYNPSADAITKKRAELLKRASNKTVADAFGNVSANKMNSALNQYLDHVQAQRRVANDATTKARIEDARINAVTDYSQLMVAMDITAQELTQQGIRNGMPPEVVLNEIQKANNDTVEATILAQIPTSTRLARGLLEAYGERLDGLTSASIVDKIEAQERQNMADYERGQRQAKQALEDAQDANMTQLIVGIARGEIKDSNLLVNTLETGGIDTQRYFTAQNYLDRVNAGLTKNGDPTAFNEYSWRIQTGQLTDRNIFMNDDTLDTTQQGKLSDQLVEAYNTDPILTRSDIEWGQDMVEKTMVGEANFFNMLSQDEKARAVAAVTEYRNRSIKEHKEQPDRLFQEELARDILSKYTDKLVLQVPPSTWPPELKWGDQATAAQGLEMAANALLKKLDRREITREAFYIEFEKIAKYKKMLGNTYATQKIKLEETE